MDGPKTAAEAAAANTDDDYGVYQIYGMHDVTGPDTLLYIGQADRGSGKFSARALYHEREWGRWNPDRIKIHFGRAAGLQPVTDAEWGILIDKAEAVLIWKIGIPFNGARIRRLTYDDKPILVINHGRRHRLPECVSTITEFVSTDEDQFKQFGPSGYPVSPPVPPQRDHAGEE